MDCGNRPIFQLPSFAPGCRHQLCESPTSSMSCRPLNELLLLLSLNPALKYSIIISEPHVPHGKRHMERLRNPLLLHLEHPTRHSHAPIAPVSLLAEQQYRPDHYTSVSQIQGPVARAAFQSHTWKHRVVKGVDYVVHGQMRRVTANLEPSSHKACQIVEPMVARSLQ